MKKIFLFIALIATFSTVNAQWIQTNGPYGASISALLTQGDTIFAGTLGGGVYFSDNNGSTWTKRSSGITSPNANAFYRQGTDIFVGTSDRIFKTTNYGASWTQLSTGWASNVHVTSIQSNGTNMFAGADNNANNGVFTSTNNGASWSSVLTGTNIGSIAVIGTDVYACATGSGLYVYKSVNNGASWTNVNSNLPVSISNINVLLADGSDLYGGAASGGIFKTSNGATTWTAVNTGISSTVSILSMTKDGSDIYAGTSSGIIYKTSNGGASWTIVNTGLPGTDILALCGNGTKVFSGTFRAGIFQTANNGGLWADCSTGIYSPVFSLGIKGSSLYAGTDGAGIFYSNNQGASYASKTVVGMPQRVITINFDSSRVVAAFDGTGSKGLYSSANNGTSWTLKNSSFSGKAVYSTLIGGTNWYAGTNNGGIYASNNSTTSWTNTSTGLPLGTNTGVFSLAQDATGIYAGVFFSSGAYVYKSTNSGASWTATGSGPSSTVYSIVIDGANIYAGTSGGVYISTNGGTSWTTLNTGLSSTFVYALALDGSDLYAGTFSGVFRLSSGASSWTNISFGLPAASTIRSIAIDATDIYVGTTSSGVWKASLTGPTIAGSFSPDKHAINIFPNPSSGLVAITGVSGEMNVQVTDMLGRTVSIQKIRTAELNLDHLENGLYNIRIINEKGEVFTKQIVIRK